VQVTLIVRVAFVTVEAPNLMKMTGMV